MRTTTLRTRDGCPVFYGHPAGIVDYLNNLEPDRLYDLDMSYFDLRALDWNGRRGNDIDFAHSNLCGANITESIFEDCNFSYALLPFLRASLTRFVRCDFSEAEFGATDVSGCIFEDCSFSGPGFFRLDLSTAAQIKNCVYNTMEQEKLIFHKAPLILHGHKSPLAFFEAGMLCAAPQKLHLKDVSLGKMQLKINQKVIS